MDSNANANELIEIKEQLQRQGKLLRWLTVGLVAVVGSLLMGAAYSHSNFFEDIKVRRLALVDAKGVERIILETDSKYVNVNGKIVARGPGVSGIILQNEKGDEVGGMATNTNGIAAIMLDGYSSRTKNGMSERVGLVSLPDGRAGLMLVDLEGKVRARLMSDSQMDIAFDLSGKDEQPRISGKVSEEGKATWSK